MFSYLLVAFIVMPLIELWLLLQVGAHVGWKSTLALVIVTGVTGAWLARAQGAQVMREIQRDMANGVMPAPRLIDGAMILVAGVLLITPGLITDTLGFLLLLPPVRSQIRVWMRRKLERKLREGTVTFRTRD
ncbi:MAG TPA: membrane protein FxsA [Verrucomicrobia bacterium]|nr:membrane protein FxsA [Verrucomicrobiota bacterium]